MKKSEHTQINHWDKKVIRQRLAFPNLAKSLRTTTTTKVLIKQLLGFQGISPHDMWDWAGLWGGISYMEREADHNEGGKDGCCSGWTFLALTQWSELARVPTGPGIMAQAAGLLVGLVWGGGIPEFQPGWSGMATPPHLAPRQYAGPNQQDAPWQAYLINGVVVGRVGGLMKERVWEKEFMKTK